MKTRFTVTLAVLALVAVGAFNESITTTTSAQSSSRPQPILKGTPTPAGVSSSKTLSATCFCKVTANGSEVAKPTKGGYVQPFQAEACRNYCRGLWDSSQQQREAWAKLLPNACGDVSLVMEAALGTMSYQQVRSEIEHGINGTHFVTNCTCPSGKLLSNAFAGNRYCLTSTGYTIPFPVLDQILKGNQYLVQSQIVYLINGPASCATTCQ